MREIVLCGDSAWIETQTAEARGRIEAIAAALSFAGTWETAEDPFFLPTSQGKALIQRLQETKKEFVVRNPSPLAVASINRHGAFFGERFHIALAAGGPAHTACIAFDWIAGRAPRKIPDLSPPCPNPPCPPPPGQACRPPCRRSMRVSPK